MWDEPTTSLWTTDCYSKEQRAYPWRKESNLKRKLVSDAFHIPSSLYFTAIPSTRYCYPNFKGFKTEVQNG